MLEVTGVCRSFGGLKAVNDVCLSVGAGEIVGIIGPNGAGKTTLVNLICGYHKIDNGKVVMGGVDITNKGADFVARSGIVRTFQIEKAFKDMTVRENIATGALMRAKGVSQAFAVADGIMHRFGLEDQANAYARNLTVQSRKMLEFARAYATSPKLIVLDEVMAGLTSGEIDKQLSIIADVVKEGISFLIIEHIMYVIMSVSRRIVVMQEGCKIADGPPKQIVNDPKVITAYLGEGGANL